MHPTADFHIFDFIVTIRILNTSHILRATSSNSVQLKQCYFTFDLNELTKTVQRLLLSPTLLFRIEATSIADLGPDLITCSMFSYVHMSADNKNAHKILRKKYNNK